MNNRISKRFAKLDLVVIKKYNSEAEEGCPSGLRWRS